MGRGTFSKRIASFDWLVLFRKERKMADKFIRTVVMLSLFLALFSSCGTQGTLITDADNGEQITIQSGDVVTVSLVSNPTTGYSWQVMETGNTILVQDGHPEYKEAPGSESLVGAGGTEVFRFKAVETGTTMLELGYLRSWESVPPIETFRIQVVVE
jgi:inhibitor of cysteine peptidase